jgi:hypothetical protein
LNKFARAKKLDPSMTSDMLMCIVQDFVAKGVSMGNVEFELMASKIAELFEENKIKYYVAPGKHTKSISKGKLPDKYRNFLGKIRVSNTKEQNISGSNDTISSLLGK